MKINIVTFTGITLFSLLWLLSAPVHAEDPTSAYGKYRNLVQKLSCSSDRKRFGKYNDYGYWGGGPWCGQNGEAGYWVYVYPDWYIWASKSIPSRARVNGKYSNLLQTINCPRDRRTYGKFREYGYWGGGNWCGQNGKAGYWVWVNPNWYVWGKRN